MEKDPEVLERPRRPKQPESGSSSGGYADDQRREMNPPDRRQPLSPLRVPKMKPCAHLSTNPLRRRSPEGGNAASSASSAPTMRHGSPPSACTPLQHRGQEAAGHRRPATASASTLTRAWATSPPNFSAEAVINGLAGKLGDRPRALFHPPARPSCATCKPLFAEFESGGFAIAHNGNLTNAMTLRRSLIKRGCLFQSTLGYRGDRPPHRHQPGILDPEAGDRRAAPGEGARTPLVMLSTEALIGVRDPRGGAAAGDRQDGATPSFSPRRPARWRSSARISSATWSRARW